MSVGCTVDVEFEIGTYHDTVECDVVSMNVCHLLLGRPWQYNHAVIHKGRTNQHKFMWNNKEVILRLLTPSQIVNDNIQKIEAQVKSERGSDQKSVILQKVSESHKLKPSGKRKNEGEQKLVMVATKSDLRAMRDDSTLMHFVLLYKDALLFTNDLTSLPSVISHIL